MQGTSPFKAPDYPWLSTNCMIWVFAALWGQRIFSACYPISGTLVGLQGLDMVRMIEGQEKQ